MSVCLARVGRARSYRFVERMRRRVEGTCEAEGDWTIFASLAGAAAALVMAALLAGYGPARRASRIDPMVALRHE